ncbi:PREDICTED: serine proteinase stubble-like [Acromyrmex echinatior]|uniref:serine proteinase stubble-like n=1 Tax=Acromyrmex echinatior TaxID=103372 RepID=UPI000580E9AB|nr:PREDICTED: serine proteinase stubble-like [Acromyrmex echinatior]
MSLFCHFNQMFCQSACPTIKPTLVVLVHVTGWDRFYERSVPSVLQEIAVPVINNTVCKAMYKNADYIEHIRHILICADWKNGEFHSCEGDSGGGPKNARQAMDPCWNRQLGKKLRFA